MKHLYKILSVMLIVAFIFSLAGCKPQDIVSDINSVVSNVDNSSEITSTEDISSTEGTSSEEISSGEDETSSEGKVSSNTSSNASSNPTSSGSSTSSKPSSNTSSKPTSSGNSTSSKPSSNTSSTVSKPTTNTSSTASKPSQNTSSTKPLSWKEKMESYGYEVLFDENVKLYYRTYDDAYIYEAKYDGINTERDSDYSNWDPTIKMYYKIVIGCPITSYDGGWKGDTDSQFWKEKYRNGYWKIDIKWYTDGTGIAINEYEYEADTSYDSSLCEYCGKKRGNGTNNTCSISFRWHEDWRCVICGTIVAKYHCHSCPDEYHSDLIGGYRESLN